MPSNNFDVIKKRVRIRDVFDGEVMDVSLGWKACCPFHAENEPSFTVSEIEGGDLYYCHGCKSGGDVFKFIQETQHVNHKEAYRILAEKAGMEVDDYYYPVDELMPVYNNLQYVHSFFEKKGISQETLKRFGVGYISDISTFNIDPALALKWHLGTIKDSIFYPVRDSGGVSIGYYTRPLYTSNNKYLGNSPIQLFGLDQLERNAKVVLIVEGQNDVLKLHDKGVRNVLGACGTNFNENMFRLLSEHGIRHVVFVPDKDGGGMNFYDTVVKKYGTFNTHGVVVGIALMPYDGGNIDPDEYIDIDREFFVDITMYETSPILLAFNALIKENKWARLSHLIGDKGFLPAYEIQLSLKEALGGVVDIRTFKKGFFDESAEKIVIGNMLRDFMIRSSMAVELESTLFVIPEHQHVFQYIVDNPKANVETIKNTFEIEFEKNDVHGNDIYVQKLKECAKKRKMLEVFTANTADLFMPTASVDLLVRNIVDDLSSVIDTNTHMVTSDNVVLSTIEDINSDVWDGMPISDKFPYISNVLRGWLKGKLVLIGGNSGEGKTSLALNITDSLANRQNYKVGYMTGEMSPNELMLRFFSIYSGHNYNAILDKRDVMSPEDIKAMMHKRIVFSSLPPIEDFIMTVKMMKMKHGIDALMVDYVQLMQSRTGRWKGQRYEELQYVTQVGKQLAQELDINITFMTQLNKENTNEAVSKITNASGAYNMVADADIGITIKRKHNVTNSILEGNCEINIDKLRYNTDDIIVPIYYDVSSLRMYELKKIQQGAQE